jgi:hypothetical protein
MTGGDSVEDGNPSPHGNGGLAAGHLMNTTRAANLCRTDCKSDIVNFAVDQLLLGHQVVIVVHSLGIK